MFYDIPQIRNMIAARQMNFIGVVVRGPHVRPAQRILAACCNNTHLVGCPFLHNKDHIIKILRLLFADVPKVTIDDFGSFKSWICKASHAPYWNQLVKCLTDQHATLPPRPTKWPRPRESPCNHAPPSKQQRPFPPTLPRPPRTGLRNASSTRSESQEDQSSSQEPDKPPEPDPPTPPHFDHPPPTSAKVKQPTQLHTWERWESTLWLFQNLGSWLGCLWIGSEACLPRAFLIISSRQVGGSAPNHRHDASRDNCTFSAVEQCSVPSLTSSLT